MCLVYATVSQVSGYLWLRHQSELPFGSGYYVGSRGLHEDSEIGEGWCGEGGLQ